jgi:hypothetical protein
MNVNKNKKIEQENRTLYVKDIWLALKLFTKIIATTIFYVCIFYIFLGNLNIMMQIISAFLIICCCVFAIKVFINYNKGIVVSSEENMISLPATDVENSIIDIITLRKFRNYAKRIEIPISEIDKAWLDRKRKTVSYIDNSGKKSKVKKKTITIYTINIAGAFGSQNIEFSSRQKRDEFRSALSICAKDLGLKIKVGSNIDMQ